MNSEFKWTCPVCDAASNQKGYEFRSERAVAYHIVGKAKLGSSGARRPHMRWIQFADPQVDSSWRNDQLVDRILDAVRHQAAVTAAPKQGTDPLYQASVRPHARQRILDDAVETETRLRSLVKMILAEAYGIGDCCWCDAPWWYKGVDSQIRHSLLTVRDQRAGNGTPLEYAGFNELKQIVLAKRNWSFFADPLKRAGFGEKAVFSEQADHVQQLRNDAVHGRLPREEFSDTDADTVERFAERVKTACTH